MSNLVVTASALNLRDAPNLDGNVIAILERGDLLEPLDTLANGYWKKVRHGSDTGWVAFKYLQPVIEGNPVPGFPWYDIARRELGVAEIEGAGDNPRIVDYLRSTTLAASMAANDETPWCSAFVNFCVEQAGYAGTDSAMARSWLKWGRPTDTPHTGCIVVFERGAPPSGHVGFYVSHKAGEIQVLGGNQGNKVSLRPFPESRLIGYRVPR